MRTTIILFLLLAISHSLFAQKAIDENDLYARSVRIYIDTFSGQPNPYPFYIQKDQVTRNFSMNEKGIYMLDFSERKTPLRIQALQFMR